jgi:nucleoside-diphosphate-sugar epimerase
MNILLFGSNGNLGNQLVKKFIKDKKIQKIFLVDLETNSKSKSKKIKYINFKNLKKFALKDKIEVIIFASFIMNFKEANPNEYLKKNIRIIKNGLRFLSINKIKKIIYFSSIAVYGNQKLPCDEKARTNPINIYGKTKLHIEKLIQKKSKNDKFKYLILRLPHMYGPQIKNNFIYFFLRNKDKIIINGDGNQIRNLLHVHDLYNFILKALTFKTNNIFNLSNEEFSLNSILKMIGATPKYKSAIKEPKYQKIIAKKARKLFGWQPKLKLKSNIKYIL